MSAADFMAARIAGIPCLIDIECDGSFEVCDSRRRPAPWLAAKMTLADEIAIELAIVAEKKERDSEYAP